MYRICCLLLLISVYALGNEANTISFVKSFIANERKPSHLIYKLCWPKHEQVKMVKEIAKTGTRSSAMIITSKHQDHGILFLLDLGCPMVESVVSFAISKDLFSSPYRWLVLTNSSVANPSVMHILDGPVYVDSDVVLAGRNGSTFQMNEIYKPATAGPIVYSRRGFFNGTLADERPHREMFRRRRDTMGHPLTMSVVIQDSNTSHYHLPIESRAEPQYDSIAKISWSNVKLAFEILNATPRYIFSHRWGYKVNGTWSGMINDLNTNRADVGTNSFITLERLSVATYSDMMAPFKLSFIFRQPPLSSVYNIFSLTFSSTVWISIVFSVILCTLTLYLSSRHEARFGTSPNQLDGSVGDALLLSLSAVSQQGCVMEPRKVSGRIIVWAIFAAFMALYAAYSANIVVLLQAPSGSIRTLSQLANSKITLAALDVDYNRFIFQNPNDSVRIEIVKKLVPEKGRHNYYPLHEGVEMLREGLFAFHCVVSTLYRRIEETFLEIEKCDLSEVTYFSDSDGFLPMKKTSPYRELLRVAFKQIHESGVHSVHVTRFQVQKPRCNGGKTAFSSVGIGETLPIVIFMLYGFALACVIAGVELLVFRIKIQVINSILCI